jgi:hypothetical protein
MPITPNTRFVGIESELVDLQERKSALVNKKTNTYSLDEMVAGFRLTDTTVLAQTDWNLNGGLYELQLNNANITATSYVVVIPFNSDITIVQAAELLPENDSFDGYVMVYSKNLPSADINVTLNIFI